MRCAVALCGVDSANPVPEDMTCGGKGATNGPEGLWCVASWASMWANEYPDYSVFLTEKPWERPNR